MNKFDDHQSTTAKKLREHIDGLDQSKLKGNPKAIVDAIDEFCKENKMMTVGPVKGKVIIEELEKLKPKNMAELGSFVGYSALSFAPYVLKKYYCLELEDQYVEVTRHFVELAGLTNVEIIQGKAVHGIVALKEKLQGSTFEPLDALFIDHAKDLYIPDLRAVESTNLLVPGSIIIADNIKHPGVPGYTEYVRGSPEERLKYNESVPNINGSKFQGRWNLLYESREVDFDFDTIEITTVLEYLNG